MLCCSHRHLTTDFKILEAVTAETAETADKNDRSRQFTKISDFLKLIPRKKNRTSPLTSSPNALDDVLKKVNEWHMFHSKASSNCNPCPWEKLLPMYLDKTVFSQPQRGDSATAQGNALGIIPKEEKP